MSDLESLSRQYKDASNLQARSSLHGRFQTNRYGWGRWLFDRFDFQADCRVLDVGCGDGGLWNSNRGRIGAGWHITLMDFSPGMITESQRRLGDLRRDVRFIVADAHKIPFEDGSFDAVIANHMLYHVDTDRCLPEIHRVLRPGGHLHASTVGQDQMRELRDLVKHFAPDLPFVKNVIAGIFSLENGAKRLGCWFDRIGLDCYEDSLEVTETEPLLEYILSTPDARDALTPDAVAELRRRMDERIASAGTFHITKSHGLFTATRKEDLR